MVCTASKRVKTVSFTLGVMAVDCGDCRESFFNKHLSDSKSDKISAGSKVIKITGKSDKLF